MKDFRGIRELGIHFEPDMTVIVGRNGAGKTSILDALGDLARLFRSNLKGRTRGSLRQELSSRDVRLGTSGFDLGLRFDFEDEWSNSNGAEALRIKYTTDTDTATYHPSDRLRRWSDTIEFQPRFIYYRQNRGFEKSAPAAQNSDRTFDPEAIQDSSLNKDLSAIGDLEAWGTAGTQKRPVWFATKIAIIAIHNFKPFEN